MSFSNWTAATYGDARYQSYDRQIADLDDTSSAVAFLRAAAGGRPALELGVGTGRLAIPLAESGVPVCGVDTSPRMLDQLRLTPGGDLVDAHLTDAADFHLENQFHLIWIAFNSFFLIDDKYRQQSCMHAVARHLTPNGRFVVECFVPRPAEFGDKLRVMGFDESHVVLQVSRHNLEEQVLETVDIELESGSTPRLFPTRSRYCWPHDLDVMAATAGLHLVERWASWDRVPFDQGTAAGHVSVYGRL